MKPVGRVVHEITDHGAGDVEFRILSPRLSDDPRAHEFMALLPVMNFNRLCLEQLNQLADAAAASCYVGVFASDPLHRSVDLFASIERVRPLGIANFPTVGLYQGDLGSSLSDAGYSVEAELELLRAARSRGMRAAAFVTSVHDGEMALEMGTDLLIVHPGLATSEAAAAHAESARTLVTTLSAKAVRTHSRVLFYLPAGSAREMSGAADPAYGVVVHSEASVFSP